MVMEMVAVVEIEMAEAAAVAMATEALKAWKANSQNPCLKFTISGHEFSTLNVSITE